MIDLHSGRSFRFFSSLLIGVLAFNYYFQFINMSVGILLLFISVISFGNLFVLFRERRR